MKKNIFIIAAILLIGMFLSTCSEGIFGSLKELEEQAIEENSGGKTYTVTFDLNGGSGGDAPPAQTVPAGSDITLPSLGGFTRLGFAYDGWNTEIDGSGDDYAEGSVYTVNGNITFFVKWSTTYTVTYDVNYGSGTITPAFVTVTPGSSVTLPAQTGLTRTNYSLGGWNTQADGKGTTYAVGDSFTPASSVTIYVIWMNTITFNGNNLGGSGSPPPAITEPAGASITLPGQGTLTRPGYSFAGWGTEAGGGTTYSAGATYVTAGNATLYAQWSTTFTVTFSNNGGSGTAAAQTVAPSTYITLPSGTGFTKTGYSFGAWNTLDNGQGTSYNAGASYQVTGTITLYARWDSTVTYDANGGSNAPPASQTVAPGVAVTIPNNTLSRTNFVFDGWNSNATGTGTPYAVGSSFTPTVNTTLYAKWVHEVTFDTNSGTGTPPPALRANPQASSPDNRITLPSDSGSGFSFSRSGYGFGGWNTNYDGTGTNYAAGATYIPTANITLYAKWNPNLSGTVTIVPNKTDGDDDLYKEVDGPWINATLRADTTDNLAGPETTYVWKTGATTLKTGTGTDNTYKVEDNGAHSIIVTVTRTGYNGSVDSAPYSINNVIGIYNRDDLQAIGPLGTNRNYILAKNIENPSISYTWTPITLGPNCTFDGNGKKINLQIMNHTFTTDTDIALFYQLNNGSVVKNLSLSGFIEFIVDVSANPIQGVSSAAALVYSCYGTVKNVKSTVHIWVEAKYSGTSIEVGGIVARLQSGGLIENCYTANIEVSKTLEAKGGYNHSVGGLVAMQSNNSTIRNCWTYGPILSTDSIGNGFGSAGGISGGTYSGHTTAVILNCVALQNTIRGGGTGQTGRITSGNASGLPIGQLSNNYARSDMQVNFGTVTTGTTTDINGANVTVIQYQSGGEGWWKASSPGANWASVWGGTNESAPWKWGTLQSVGQAPVLWFE